MSGFVVVDASVAVKWLLKEDRSDEARSLAQLWESRGVRMAAPYFMPAEVSNALHRRVILNEMSAEEAVVLIEVLLASGVELHSPPGLYTRALELASMLGQGAVYDSNYLALAQVLGCEYWTADRRFYRGASAVVQNVRWIGEFVAPG